MVRSESICARRAALPLMLLCLLFALALTACSASTQSSSNDKFIGTWTLSAFETDGETFGAEEIADLGLQVGLSVSSDGTAYLSVNGTVVGDKYSISGNTLTIVDAEDGSKIPLQMKGESLVLDFSKVDPPLDEETRSGMSSWEFVRVSSESDAKESNFVGLWSGVDVQTDDMDSPLPLSSYDMSVTLDVRDSLTGKFTWKSAGGNTIYSVKLEKSDKTTDYLVIDQESGNTLGSVGYYKNGGKEWLLFVTYLAEDKYMQISLSR